ncbi:MAG: amidohydrolase family protein [Gammaproteobacteria bacterium]|nr:amidohydrolase family protein [Gammaproteobacteria bacterium]MYE50116.1 amidohydrolase family protein [Gammaproteobacteria bacterium]MYF49272.1 amidohydrolase family protein [Gammaproteobacteria bacterium]
MTGLPTIIQALLLFLALSATAHVAAASRHDRAAGAPCEFTPSASADQGASGLIVGAEVLLPAGSRPNQGVHIRFNGGLGMVGDFDAVRAALPDAAVLDCRGAAVLSPGFVNAHEHPAYSYEFPDPKLNPGYVHRDGWRLGTSGALQLPIPEPLQYEPGDRRSAAMLLAMELRHLLGGATTIAGPGGLPGVVRNINRHSRVGDIELYDYEADVEVFPFSFEAVEDLRDECAGGAAHRFPPPSDPELAFMAYVAHVGEGRKSSCAARAEVARYLQRAQRRDRRYALVHGVATDREDYAVMREFDVTLVWSPRSNLALYGETLDIAGAVDSGVRVALSTDWSPSGSFSMREELQCARRVASAVGVALPAEKLWRMSTVNGAYALGLEDRFGAIEPGLRADLILVAHADGDPHDAVLTATDNELLAAWVDGRAILLSEALPKSLGAGECVALEGMAPRACGVLAMFDLSPAAFAEHVEGAVPINDNSRQAPCEARR